MENRKLSYTRRQLAITKKMIAKRDMKQKSADNTRILFFILFFCFAFHSVFHTSTIILQRVQNYVGVSYLRLLRFALKILFLRFSIDLFLRYVYISFLRFALSLFLSKSFYVKIVNGQKPSTNFTKNLHRRCSTGF